MNLMWVLDKYWINTKCFIKDLVFSNKLIVRNRRFQNLHKNDRIFILGSGHSIKKQDLKKLHGHIVMTQNHFHAHEDIQIINPTYHVIVPKYQPREYDKDWVEWLNSMNNRLPARTIMFFGENTKYLVDQLNLFQGRAYYVRSGYVPSIIRRAPTDLTRTIMGIPTVLTQCLTIAIYMGFKEIVLMGFDLDQIYRKSDLSKMRFYGFSPVNKNECELKVEEYTGPSGNDWLSMWEVWLQCNLLKAEAERLGIKIINATRGGLLNIFERRIYEEIVG